MSVGLADNKLAIVSTRLHTSRSNLQLIGLPRGQYLGHGCQPKEAGQLKGRLLGRNVVFWSVVESGSVSVRSFART